jgi:gamma-glutamyltranspeptidase / glutathione hydrolase
LLTMANEYPLQDWGYKKKKTTHLMIETERRVYADRAEYLGDPHFYKVPVEGLLDTTYIKS